MGSFKLKDECSNPVLFLADKPFFILIDEDELTSLNFTQTVSSDYLCIL
jgi:hypothetical protein